MAENEKNILENIGEQEYKYGFTTDIETETIGKGLSEEVVRLISAKKGEPEWLLERRLKAFEFWQTMKEPSWAKLSYDKIDYQDLYYYSAPKRKAAPKSLDEVDKQLLETYDKLGIPLKEQEALAGVVAVDAVFDSVSVATTYRARLAEKGIIFCSISEAVKEHPELVKKYLGSVVPYTDNFFACLNSAVFTDGSFVYIPKGVRCPMELSTYFRINAKNTGQFERTLIIADEGSYVSYLEGCTAPQRDENQLHAAIVEIVVLDNAEVKYSTVQNWYPGDKDGKGGVYNFVTKRAACRGVNSKVSWTQVETGSAVTWKYPSCVLQGDNSVGEFYSVALTNNRQQAGFDNLLILFSASSLRDDGLTLDYDLSMGGGVWLNGGHLWTLTWTQGSDSTFAFYDADGRPFNLLAGRSYLALVSSLTGQELTVTNSAGEALTAASAP